jgi:hypothetical protein
MLHEWVSSFYRLARGTPAFRVYGKGRSEPDYSVIDIYATSLRDFGSGVPLMEGSCITWTSSLISVGWEFAAELLREQITSPASRQFPVGVLGTRLNDPFRRHAVSASPWPSHSEILAHECGHTAQARRMGGLYWLIGAALTLCREGPNWWNEFENRASEGGQFGGIVSGSICDRLLPVFRRESSVSR